MMFMTLSHSNKGTHKEEAGVGGEVPSEMKFL
jgi:hypothetical protein